MSSKEPNTDPSSVPEQQEPVLPQIQPADLQRPVVVQQIEYSFSGPLPPTRELQGYESVLPGAAERIFQMREAEIRLTEKQVTHRLGLENRVIDSDIRNSRIGVISANIWLFAGLGMTVLFVMTGHDKAGEIIGPSVIASILTAFITGNYNRRKERLDKTKLLTGQKDATQEKADDLDPPAEH